MVTPSWYVCLGASAGGLDAFGRFLENIGPELSSQACFILVQHLDPEHESELASLLSRRSAVPVRLIEGDEQPQCGQAYVIPPGKDLFFRSGRLRLSEPGQPRGKRTPIDRFLRSLSHQVEHKAVCVILSGTGSDGSLGLKAVKEGGGLVLVQSTQDASYDGMPRSALDTGLVDLEAPVSELPLALERIVASEDATEFEPSKLNKIFGYLRNEVGHDFRGYKPSTLRRRLTRRMQVTRCKTLDDYIRYLREEQEEPEILFKDFLLTVTSFFRDREAFQALDQEVVGDFDFNEHTIRAWVPGCATGEEAFSLGMLLSEVAERKGQLANFQIFASDLDEGALDFARQGVFSETAILDLPEEYRDKYFHRAPGGYRVADSLAERVLFTQHNLLQDPPFSRLDLLSCRNVLIYLQRELQDRLFQLFAFALRPGGILFLGGAESLERESGLFVPVNKAQRIYRRRHAPVKAVGEYRPFTLWQGQQERLEGSGDAVPGPTPSSVHKEMLLERFGPPSVLVDRASQIRHLYGKVGQFLVRGEGEPSDNLLENLPPEIVLDVRTALFDAFHRAGPGESRRLRLCLGEQQRRLEVQVDPVRDGHLEDPYAAVSFLVKEDRKVEPGPESDENPDSRRMEEELRSTRERLRTVVEEFETSNEELRSSNEELQSMNEELLSTSEELETSREELQSTNEELVSVNQELKNKIDELHRSNADLSNLMATVEVGTLFVDREMQVRRYTPRVEEIFHLIPADIGRPLEHIVHRVEDCDLVAVAREVLRTLQPVEHEVRTESGSYYAARFLPYRSTDDRIEGIVLTFLDITERRKERIRLARMTDRQTCLSELGLLTLRGASLADVCQRAVQRTVDLLDADFGKVLKLGPKGRRLYLRHGVGWKEGLVGEAWVQAGEDSQAGYTLRHRGPVVVKNLVEETRFRGPELLTSHQVVSGLSVVIECEGQPYGVLGIHCRTYREFDDIDADFLQGIANVLGSAAEREASTRRLARERTKLEQILEQMPAAVVIADQSKDAQFMNRAARELFDGSGQPGFHHADGGPFQRLEYPHNRALLGETILGQEVAIRDATGRERFLLCNAAPIAVSEGETVEQEAIAAYQDISDRKQSELELKRFAETLERRVAERSEQVRNLAAELTRAEQQERRRLSNVLHDDLQQLLYSIQVQLHLLQNSDESHREDLYNLMNGVIRRAIQVTRSLTVELTPPVLDGGGLREALGWLADQMEKLHNLKVHVEAESDLVVQDREFRVLLLQVLREMLFNVVKHSGVQEARVTLQTSKDHYLISVEDDGCGFSGTGPVGVGLSSCRDRLQLFGGRLDIHSTQGEGTRLTVWVPLEVLRER